MALAVAVSHLHPVVVVAPMLYPVHHLYLHQLGVLCGDGLRWVMYISSV